MEEQQETPQQEEEAPADSSEHVTDLLIRVRDGLRELA